MTTDEKVEAWHNGAGEGLELHEYLGWTIEQYSHWVSTNEEPETDDFSITDLGAVLRLARAATRKALQIENDRLREAHDESTGKFKFDNLGFDVMIYTDDPSSATWMAMSAGEVADVCGVSGVEGVAIVMGENFPPSAVEAERPDPELPRLAVLLFRARGSRCERCWKHVAEPEQPLCKRCDRVVSEIENNS